MIVPFRWRHSRISKDRLAVTSSERCVWLRLVNKLQILALVAPSVGTQLERIVDAILEELRR